MRCGRLWVGVLMGDRDVRRIEIVTEVLSGRRTVASAAIVLAISARQVHRLLIRFREDGGEANAHEGGWNAHDVNVHPARKVRRRTYYLALTDRCPG
ncbi:MAG TPA: helix-turn-helix domain-containing protein [Edaphobacter sp.]|nr:helix-turn-helix domain-containing protein [Edaphobacter sp.]